MTQRLIDEMTRRNISLLRRPGHAAAVGDPLGLDPRSVWETDCQLIGPLLPRRMGAFTYSRSQMGLPCEVGRYCSIGKALDFMLDRHPVEWASTSPFSYQKAAPSVAGYLKRQGAEALPRHDFDPSARAIRIGHDVFIGNGVWLKSGVSIGNGAVIGGGSVVTKDVPPYAVVGGAPARLIRFRFEPDLIERFQTLDWWRFGPDRLLPLQVPDPAAFLDGIERLIADQVAGAKVGKVSGSQIVEWCSNPESADAAAGPLTTR